MSAFEFFFSFYGLLLGLSVAELVGGFARVLHVAATPLDAHYTMAKVHWHLRFEKTPGAPQDFRFHITYFLFDPGSGTGPKVAFYISHEDEQQVMREAGLLPDAPTDGATRSP